MDAPRAIWNPARDVWEMATSIDLFSEHLDVFSATWPPSGMTRHGREFALPTLAHLTSDSGRSSPPGLPTPRASDLKGGAYPVDRPENMDNLETRIKRLLLTTTAADSEASGGSSSSNVTLTDAVVRKQLPTPTASNSERTSDEYPGGNPTLRGALMPTPTTSNRNGNDENSRGELLLPGVAMSLLPTPNAAKAGSDVELTKSGDGREKPNKLGWAVALLPTPNAALASKGGTQSPEKRRAGGHQPGLDDVAVTLLPTPVAQPSGNTPEQHCRKKPGRTRVTDLSVLVENGLLPTGGRIELPLSDGSE